MISHPKTQFFKVENSINLDTLAENNFFFFYLIHSSYFYFQELVTTHEISHVCCVVRDPSNPKVFGYVTTTETGQSKNVAHVFTTDSEVRLST